MFVDSRVHIKQPVQSIRSGSYQSGHQQMACFQSVGTELKLSMMFDAVDRPTKTLNPDLPVYLHRPCPHVKSSHVQQVGDLLRLAAAWNPSPITTRATLPAPKYAARCAAFPVPSSCAIPCSETPTTISSSNSDAGSVQDDNDTVCSASSGIASSHRSASPDSVSVPQPKFEILSRARSAERLCLAKAIGEPASSVEVAASPLVKKNPTRGSNGSGNETIGIHEGCVTLMLRNIPNHCMPMKLADFLFAAGYQGDIDFLFVPMDFKTKANVGYAFISFRSTEACARFVKDYHEKSCQAKFGGCESKKVFEVVAARLQGRERNVVQLQNSPVMKRLKKTPEWLPMIFDEAGVLEQFPFP